MAWAGASEDDAAFGTMTMGTIVLASDGGSFQSRLLDNYPP